MSVVKSDCPVSRHKKKLTFKNPKFAQWNQSGDCHESSPNLALWRACYTRWLAPSKSLCRQGAHRSSEHCNTTLQVYASHDSQGQCAYPACPKKRFTSPAMQPSWSSKMKVSLSCKAGQEAATWDFRLRTRYQKWNWNVSNASLTPLTGTATNI